MNGCRGNETAWMAFLDRIQEEDVLMWNLKVGEIVFIETPTVYAIGEIEELGLMHLRLKPGAHEIRTLNNLYTFLNDGKYHQDDEATPLPGYKIIPALSVVNVHQWVHEKMPKPNRTPAQMRGNL